MFSSVLGFLTDSFGTIAAVYLALLAYDGTKVGAKAAIEKMFTWSKDKL